MEPGTKVNRWTVMSNVRTWKNGRWYIKCQCECGTVRDVEKRSLETKSTGGCGKCNRKPPVYKKEDIEEEIKAEKIASAAKHGAVTVYLMGKRVDSKKQTAA